ncbi:hypothetical protein B0H13DRAFT_2237295 [Mycena leptocephala]|nr:hypothetical protein B0H13DRAFT_2237295 [Mycena leptocephala]
MFCTPGILLMEGSQRSFTKIIKSMREKPTRKSTTINLDRIRRCIEEVFRCRPNASAIWTSIRSNNIHCLTRNFLWKCMHDIFHIGPYWEHVPNLEILGQCQTCGAPESLEHIMLECDASGQRQVWQQTELFWRLRWPKLNWGLLLGCGLARFTSSRGKMIPVQNRFFAIIRVFETHTQASANEIHNRWQLVLDTWSGTLLDEDSLPDDWTRSEEVLVGIRPITRKNGVG